jgi:lysophospholipase L1-like esterase
VLLTATLLALGGVALSACSGDTGTVAVVGDSITVQTKEHLDPDIDWNVAASIGATSAQMVPEAQRLAGEGPSQAVINLGTNDALQQVPVQDTEATLESIVGAFDDSRCVHLVTLGTQLPDSGQPPASQLAGQLNDWMRRFADEHDNVSIIDWDEELAGEDELLLDDHIHPNVPGRERLAAMMADAVEGC